MISDRSKSFLPAISTFSSLTVLGILISNLVTFSNAVNIMKVSEESRLTQKLPDSSKICETKGCTDTASYILSNMNKSVNPCDNFYQFACGNFSKHTALPDDLPWIDLFGITAEKTSQQLRVSIENEITDRDLRAFKLLQTYYKACMNTTQIDKSSEDDLKGILKNLGGWPVLEGQSWNGLNFDWKNAVYAINKRGFSFSYFIGLGIYIDINNASKYIINVDQPPLGLAQEYMVKGLNEPTVQAYLKYMVEFAVLLGANREQAQKDLTESLKFEIELAKISLPVVKRRNTAELYSTMTIQQLQSTYPGIPWLEYINNLLGPEIHVDANEKIVRGSSIFFENIAALLAKTPKRVLANFALWSVCYDAADQMSSRIYQLQTEFRASYTGVTVQKARWKVCLAATSNYLNEATSALYVRRHFDKSSKATALEQFRYIRTSFEKILNKTTWMDEKTKKAALEKLNAIIPIFGYPDELLDDKILDGFYQNLTLRSESYLKSQLDVNIFLLAFNIGRLRTKVNRSDWTTNSISFIVNAYYSDSENSIKVAAAILQGGFFSQDRPKYLNFGGIGWFMGHELTHGYDDNGRLYNKDGNLANWWSSSTEKTFLQRAQCIIEQYGNYTSEQIGLKVNGELTQGENIADNGGIKEAYYAYLDWEEKNGKEPQVPGLPYTSRQMFWISAANNWCYKQTSESLRNQILTDGHSPSEFRVMGSFSNRPEFSKDFGCPLGSPMNPVKKCQVW